MERLEQRSEPLHDRRGSGWLLGGEAVASPGCSKKIGHWRWFVVR